MSEEKVSLAALNLAAPGAAPQPGDANYVPPAAAVPLPSSGKVYSADSGLSGVELLEIHAMTARSEDILTSRALLKSGRALDTLLKSCMVNRFINVGAMLAGDRNALLVAIRITGYGQEYKVKIECPVCGTVVQHEFDLAKLPIKRLGRDPIQAGTNEFDFKLEISKANVTFKLLTGDDERELNDTIARASKQGSNESLVTSRLLQQIVSVNGEKDRTKIAQFIRTMPARDSRSLRKEMDRIAPGVDMVQTFKCSSCTEESEVEVPMGTEFFWPES